MADFKIILPHHMSGDFSGKNITPFDEVAIEIGDLYDEAKNWADGSPVESQAQCDALDALDESLFDAGKRLDALRVAEKRPLDEQIDAIQARYNPFIQPKKGKVDLARSALNPLRSAWKQRVAEEKAKAEEKARAEAEAERRKAEEMLRDSAAGDLDAREMAEEQLATAKEAERYAAKKHKEATTGLGLRTSYRPELTDLNAAIRHYWRASYCRGDFESLVIRLATDDVRVGVRTIPGFTIHKEHKAL